MHAYMNTEGCFHICMGIYTGELLSKVSNFPDAVNGVSFHPNGYFVATGTGQRHFDIPATGVPII